MMEKTKIIKTYFLRSAVRTDGKFCSRSSSLFIEEIEYQRIELLKYFIRLKFDWFSLEITNN